MFLAVIEVPDRQNPEKWWHLAAAVAETSVHVVDRCGKTFAAEAVVLMAIQVQNSFAEESLLN